MSPSGDSMPILIVLGASVLLRCGAETRTLLLEELYLGYQKKALRPLLHSDSGVMAMPSLFALGSVLG